jgi:hypothetical protein
MGQVVKPSPAPPIFIKGVWIMNDDQLKEAAFKIAEATPRHLDQPTIPPIRWSLEGDQLRVLLADGRTVRGVVPVLARGAPISAHEGRVVKRIETKPSPKPAKVDPVVKEAKPTRKP